MKLKAGSSKIDKALARFIKKKGEDSNHKIRNEKGEATDDTKKYIGS